MTPTPQARSPEFEPEGSSPRVRNRGFDPGARAGRTDYLPHPSPVPQPAPALPTPVSTRPFVRVTAHSFVAALSLVTSSAQFRCSTLSAREDGRFAIRRVHSVDARCRAPGLTSRAQPVHPRSEGLSATAGRLARPPRPPHFCAPLLGTTLVANLTTAPCGALGTSARPFRGPLTWSGPGQSPSARQNRRALTQWNRARAHRRQLLCAGCVRTAGAGTSCCRASSRASRGQLPHRGLR